MTRITLIRRSLVGPLAFVAFLFCLSVGVSGQSASTSLTAQQALVTEIEVNGLKVIVKRRPASGTVAAGLFFRGGVRNATAANAGLENFVLSAMAEGSDKFPREALRREIASTATAIGGTAGFDYSTLTMISTREFFNRGWDVFTDAALHPAFAAPDVELIRQRLLTSLSNDRDDPDSHLQTLVNQTVNAGTSYANDPRGTVENISKFKVADLRAHQQQMMQSSRLLLVVVGDVEPEMIRQKVTAAFSKLPRGEYREPSAPQIDFSKGTLDVTTRSLPTNYIEGVFAAPPIGHPDAYPMRVAVNILRDRVFEEVRVKRNLSYAPNAEMGSSAANVGNIYVTAVDANQAIGLMLKEIKDMKDNPVSDRDISGVAGQTLTTYFLGNETNAAQAGELARYELNGGGWRTSYGYLDKIRAVTPADVQRVVQKYMRNMRFIVVGDPAAIDRAIFLPS